MIRFLVSASGERGREDKCQQLWQANAIQTSGANDYHRTTAGAASLGTTMKQQSITWQHIYGKMKRESYFSEKTDILKIFHNFCVRM